VEKLLYRRIALQQPGSRRRTATGFNALLNNTGAFNTAIGAHALEVNTTGGHNIALGVDAGGSITTGSNNIDIGNSGFAPDSATIRIGGGPMTTFIAGIRGVTTGVADAIPVLIDSDGQLGTTSSSRRFKKEIKPMEQTSEAILSLKPVNFHYKSDKMGTPQFGLIAEEVAAVNPDLVVRDKNGEIYTVRYDAVNAMLLNEFLKEHRRAQEQQAMIAQQRNDFQAAIAQQEMEIKTLTATVREQAAQIQKVSVQLEASRSAPQTVLNNH
jgi:hypothetical protein